MPWIANPMQQRQLFVEAFLRRKSSITDLAADFNISRKTAYKWIERFRQRGLEGLGDRSRAPKTSSHATPREVVEAVIELRRARPRWGPKKLHHALGKERPELKIPSPATIGRILKNHGLSRSKRRRIRPERQARKFGYPEQPNDLWTTDFKGHFRLGNGRYCYPLTIADAATRYLIAVAVLPGTRYRETREIFEEVFSEYGLPRMVRSDNGVPFCSTAPGGLSKLSVWWIKLGIGLQRIELGKPQQNGRHERMHRTLGAETAQPPGKDFSDQQTSSDDFREDFNQVRPHEALNFLTPSELYHRSARHFPRSFVEIERPEECELRRVKRNGEIGFLGNHFYLSGVLSGEKVALVQISEHEWEASFAGHRLGRYRTDRKEFRAFSRTPKRRKARTPTSASAQS